MCAQLQDDLFESGAQGDSSSVQASLQQENRPRCVSRVCGVRSFRLMLRTSLQNPTPPTPVNYDTISVGAARYGGRTGLPAYTEGLTV